MKNLFLMIFLIGLTSFTCIEESNKSALLIDKTIIELKGIEGHPNKKYMEMFLNNYEEEFVESAEVWVPTTNDNLVLKAFDFHTKLSNISVTLIFCTTQKNALTVLETNFTVFEEFQQAGVNGGVLFVVKANDEYKLNNVLGWFAGEE